ncbi:MAG: DNA translocase FtsK [Muribaculaceae bacterium]|jgi:DNA segregation ATPase FtsK/SpoIIIE, S-DNA-T family|nr:DNA translocase FtsK [Muribaculaceae bacterium]
MSGSQENYNPDNIYAENPEKKENTANQEHIGIWKHVGMFFSNSKTRIAIGSVIGLFGVYLLISFISYLSNGASDQSSVLNESAVALAKSGAKINNAGAIFGASIGESLIYRGFGVGAFVLVIWAIVISIRLFRMGKKVYFFSYTLISLISLAACSIIVGGATMNMDLTFFPLGGNFGKEATNWMMELTGLYGTIFIDLLIAILWIILCYNTLKKMLRKAIGIIPKHGKNHGEEEEETEKEDVMSPFGGHQVGNQEEEEPTISEPIPALAGVGVSPVPAMAPVTLDDNTTVIVTKDIEKAKVVSAQAYDPTKELSRFKFPTTDLLIERKSKSQNVDIKEQEDNKKRITETLNNYGIQIKKIEVCVGPTITLFEIIPADGVRISKIRNLEDDIALSLAALGIRIIAPIPGRGTIGIEVPNKDPQTVSMRSLIESKKFQDCKFDLPMAIGCTISNEVYIADLAKMPHLLVAGATGQGKSVGLNAIITSLLYKKHPAELKFVLVDPKRVEFSLYSKLEHHYLAKIPGIDHCIVTDPPEVVSTLNSLVQEMEDRYKLLEDSHERNIKDYNKKFVNHLLNPEKGHRYMPYIVVIIDEFSDLIMVAGKEVEMPIVRIAQKARAVGIHMIIATQRPSTNVITGIIKANFPGRIAFRVSQMVDSRTILDRSGAQQLVGKGDMLFSSGGLLERIQCAFVDTPEVEAICSCIGEQVGYDEAYELPEYVPENAEPGNGIVTSSGSLNDRDPLFEEAALQIITSETASTSSLQRRYGIGYNRAGRLMDQMEAAGIVGPAQGGKPRRVLVDSTQLTQILAK